MAEGLGQAVRRFLNKVVGYVLFIWELFKNIPGAFTNLHTTVEQMHHVGITSIPVVFAASLATGAIMSWQLAYQFGDMIPMMFVGMAVGKSVMVELCPILTAMVLAGRIGASMCSELGTMAVTEQLDAYKVLGLNPYKYLLAPRLIATVIMLPVLTILSISSASSAVTKWRTSTRKSRGRCSFTACACSTRTGTWSLALSKQHFTDSSFRVTLASSVSLPIAVQKALARAPRQPWLPA